MATVCLSVGTLPYLEVTGLGRRPIFRSPKLLSHVPHLFPPGRWLLWDGSHNVSTAFICPYWSRKPE